MNVTCAWCDVITPLSDILLSVIHTVLKKKGPRITKTKLLSGQLTNLDHDFPSTFYLFPLSMRPSFLLLLHLCFCRPFSEIFLTCHTISCYKTINCRILTYGSNNHDTNSTSGKTISWTFLHDRTHTHTKSNL